MGLTNLGRSAFNSAVSGDDIENKQSCETLRSFNAAHYELFSYLRCIFLIVLRLFLLSNVDFPVAVFSRNGKLTNETKQVKISVNH